MSEKKYYRVIRTVTTVDYDSCYVKAEDEDDACDLAEYHGFDDVLSINAEVDYDVQEVSREEAIRHDVLDLDDEDEDGDYDEEDDGE